VQFFFNEASVQGQFDDVEQFRTLIEALLSARARSPYLGAMRTTMTMADRPVAHGQTVRQVVQGWRGSPIAGALLAWVGRNGPFVEEDRLGEPEDLFQCLGVEVTDGGLGEAARRIKARQDASSMSLPGGAPDFGQTPLPVVHGFEEEPISSYDVPNFWDANAALAATLELEPPATTWRATVESARARFPHLVLPDTLWQDRRLARDPFEAIIRDRIYVLLGLLNAYMEDRAVGGAEGSAAQAIIRTHFTGDRALFSGESPSNQRDFVSELTFPDSEGGPAIFAHWHGKISHRHYRIHFQWPVPTEAARLKIVYIGPKLTKS
jgi:hypothetical protein